MSVEGERVRYWWNTNDRLPGDAYVESGTVVKDMDRVVEVSPDGEPDDYRHVVGREALTFVEPQKEMF